jgi:hypothetical protein
MAFVLWVTLGGLSIKDETGQAAEHRILNTG